MRYVVTEEVKNSLDGHRNFIGDQIENFECIFPDMPTVLEVFLKRNGKMVQQNFINWSTAPGLHRQESLDVLDSLYGFYEKGIIKILNKTSPSLKYWEPEKQSFSDYQLSLVCMYESQLIATITCMANLMFSEN
jgi:hypothetical protein